MDKFDLQLLDLLQINTSRAVASIAQEVGLSVPACYRRIRRFRESGAIEREVAIVRPQTLGWPLSMIVLVMLEREGSRTIDEVMHKLQAEPEVIEAWNVTGDFDIAVRIIARDMEGYDTLVQRIFSADAKVRTYKTLVIIRELKSRGPIPGSLSDRF